MRTEYIRGAMRRAKILPDDGAYYGSIPGFDGVYAHCAALEECRDELEETLEEWSLLRVSRKLSLPELDGMTLSIRESA